LSKLRRLSCVSKTLANVQVLQGDFLAERKVVLEDFLAEGDVLLKDFLRKDKCS
jgi:hypothetical protein